MQFAPNKQLENIFDKLSNATARITDITTEKGYEQTARILQRIWLAQLIVYVRAATGGVEVLWKALESWKREKQQEGVQEDETMD